ncbi:MAG TPA: hypothetical protein VJT49_25750, partial [Amycolatopsis sp.]|nr:hypothetical protein [Amycolatopsis sp.]
GGGGAGAAAMGVGLGVAGVGLGAVAGKALLGRGNRSGAKKEREAADATGAAATEHAEQQAHGPVQNQGLMNSGGTIGAQQATPPPTGMGGMGAGAQQEEDKEHNRASFLIEADPDEAFGANVSTAPPVIGAWGDDED